MYSVALYYSIERCNMALEDYNVAKSKKICSIIKSKLGIACSYGYCDLGEYLLFPKEHTEIVSNFLRSQFMVVLEVVGVEKSNTVLLIK